MTPLMKLGVVIVTAIASVFGALGSAGGVVLAQADDGFGSLPETIFGITGIGFATAVVIWMLRVSGRVEQSWTRALETEQARAESERERAETAEARELTQRARAEGAEQVMRQERARAEVAEEEVRSTRSMLEQTQADLREAEAEAQRLRANLSDL